jgi:hypothetical protein
VTTTNVFATRYYGDGGLLSNISATFTQPLANLVVSNSVTTTNIFATSANIATMNVGYLTVNSAVVYGTSTLNVYGTSNLTNVTVRDTFNVNGSVTANAANATFFFDTFTIQYINTQVLNVASNIILSGNLSAPLANITTLNVNYLTVNSAVVYGTSTLNVYGVSNLSTATMIGTSGKTTLNVTGNVYASNAVTTTNVTATGIQTIAGLTGLTSLNVTGNLYASNAVTATTHFGNVSASNVVVTPATGVTGINVTGNIYASNAVTATNVFSTNVYASGYVGIGTTSPQTALQLKGDLLLTQGAQGFAYNSMAIQYDGNTNYGSIIGKSVKWDGTNYIVQSDGATPRCCALQMSFDNGFKFVTTSASGGSSLTLSPAQFLSNTKVVITLDGSVGIATTSPAAAFDVAGKVLIAGDSGVVYMPGTKNTGRGLEWYYADDSRYGMCQDTGGTVRIFISNSNSTGSIRFCRATSATAFTDLLTCDYNGNVGIGKNLTTGNPYWFITHSSGGNATYSAGAVWFSSTASGTFGNSITVGGTASASAFNTTSGTFTFPVAGTYLISVPMFINGATGGRYAIATFGSSIKPVSQYFEFTSTNLPSNEMRTWTYVKQVNAGDTMYLSTPAGSITLFLAETHSCLIIFKVG